MSSDNLLFSIAFDNFNFAIISALPKLVHCHIVLFEAIFFCNKIAYSFSSVSCQKYHQDTFLISSSSACLLSSQHTSATYSMISSYWFITSHSAKTVCFKIKKGLLHFLLSTHEMVPCSCWPLIRFQQWDAFTFF